MFGAVKFEQVAAVYAAVVATGGLGWQVWTWRRARRPVRVAVSLAVVGFPHGNEWVVVITVVNLSERAVRVGSAGLLMPDGRQWVPFSPAPLSSLPGPVEPQDAGKLFVAVATVEETFDLRQPMRAWASLVTGETVKSPKRRLLAKDFASGSVADRLRDDAGTS